MNNKKLSFSSLLLSFSILISTLLRAVANTQVQIVDSSNYFSLSSLIILGTIIIGLIGITIVKVLPNYGYQFPTEPSLPPEEEPLLP